jgi:hypothetical protein
LLDCPAHLLIQLDKTPPFGNGPWVPATLGPSDLNKNYQFRVTNTYSNNYCWGSVDILDNIPPSMDCAHVEVPCVVTNFSPSFIKDSLGIAAGQLVAHDNCNTAIVPTYTDTVITQPCAPSSNGVYKIISRTWTAKDQSGNKNTCVQSIAVAGNLTAVHFPPDITVSTCQQSNVPMSVSGSPYIKAGTREYPVLTAAGCKLDVNYFDTLEVINACPADKRIRRTWKVKDLCSANPNANPLIGIQHIDIKDQTAPVVHCVPDVTIEQAAPSCNPTVDLPDFVITDDCSGITDLHAFWTGHGGLTQSAAGHLADFPGNNPVIADTLGVMDTIPNFPIGITTVVYAATDACGNTGTCQFNLHVWDKTPPTATCVPGLTIYLGQSGQAFVTPAALDQGSEDDCNPVYFKLQPKVAWACQANDQWYDTLQVCCRAAIGRLCDRAFCHLPGAGCGIGYNSCVVQGFVAGGCHL